MQPILINPAYHKLHLKNQDLPVYELFFLHAPSKPSKSIFAGCFANAEQHCPDRWVFYESYTVYEAVFKGHIHIFG